MSDSLSTGDQRMRRAFLRFSTARAGLDNAPTARTLLDYQSALSELHATIQHEVNWDMAAAKERWPDAESAPVSTPPSNLRPVPYGALPLHSFVHADCKKLGRDTTVVLAEMRAERKAYGPSVALLKMLHAVNVTWAPPAGCACGALPCLCIERDVDAVLAAETNHTESP